MLYRNSLKLLEEWHKKDHRKPLILSGARQVGKSTLVKLFCSQYKIKIIEVNLEITALQKLINVGDVEGILTEIEIRTGSSFSEPNVLLFLDEIQARPEALQFLRYIYEKRADIPVIAAGSLLEFVLENPQFSMPVGRVEFLHLGPLTFSEFLMATQSEKLLEQLEKDLFATTADYFPLLEEKLKSYFFVGGMPEAVKVFAESKSYAKVREVHRSIMQTYRADFPKYGKLKQFEKINAIFDSLPNSVGKKVKYSEIQRDISHTIVKEVLHLFKNARLIQFCYHSNAKGLPLRGLKDEHTYRYFFLDIGLLMSAMGIPLEFILMDLQAHPLVEGVLAEQFVAQHLAYIENGVEEPELFYWVRDKKGSGAEVDFLVGLKGRIVPLEVKSGSSGKLKSLLCFMEEHAPVWGDPMAIRCDLKQRQQSEMIEEVEHKLALPEGSKRVNFKLFNIPLWGIEFLDQTT